MKTPALRNDLAWIGDDGQFVNDVFTLADQLDVDRETVVHKLLNCELTGLVELLVDLLPVDLREEFSANLEALARQANDFLSRSDRDKEHRILLEILLHPCHHGAH